jgi:hypothetical protein
MQNATREMLCKTFSSAADRADEEQLSEKPVLERLGESLCRFSLAMTSFAGN